jgi:DNA-binding transcriptional LysR family regulator
MNQKLLETFLWASRLGSFRAAADHLNSTQPAVSMRIRELERHFGVSLFERGRRASRLTAKGEELLPYVERTLALLQEMQHVLGDPRIASETVRVGVAEFVAVTWLPDLVGEISRRFPNVSLRLDVDLTQPLLRRLQAGEIDLALCPGVITDGGFKKVSLGRVDFGWFAAPQLVIGRRTVRPEDLAAVPMISLSEGSAVHRIAIDWFRRSSVVLPRVNFCNSMHTVSILMRSGQGFSMLPTEYCRSYVERGEIVPLRADPPLTPLEYLALYENRASPLVEAIVAIAREVSRFSGTRPNGRSAAGDLVPAARPSAPAPKALKKRSRR